MRSIMIYMCVCRFWGFTSGREQTQCLQNFGCLEKYFLWISEGFYATQEWHFYLCHIYMGSGLWDPSPLSFFNCVTKSISNLTMTSNGIQLAIFVQRYLFLFLYSYSLFFFFFFFWEVHFSLNSYNCFEQKGWCFKPNLKMG